MQATASRRASNHCQGEPQPGSRKHWPRGHSQQSPEHLPRGIELQHPREKVLSVPIAMQAGAEDQPKRDKPNADGQDHSNGRPDANVPEDPPAAQNHQGQRQEDEQVQGVLFGQSRKQRPNHRGSEASRSPGGEKVRQRQRREHRE